MGKDFTDFFLHLIKSEQLKKLYTKKEMRKLEQEYLKVYFENVRKLLTKPKKKQKT